MSECVLPALRLGRLQEDLLDLLNREQVRAVMDLVEKHLEVGAFRWGNACPLNDCRERMRMTFDNGNGMWRCPTHGWALTGTGTILLVGFRPLESG